MGEVHQFAKDSPDAVVLSSYGSSCVTTLDTTRSCYKGVTAMLHVLVVDDDQDTAASCSMLLRLCGHDVEVAVDGPSALHAARINHPDVVLLDLAMPKMDGWAVAQQIRQHRNGKRPWIVVISGYGSKADRLHSHESGIDLHLIKPVDPTDLVDLLTHFSQSVPPEPEPGVLQDRRA
jgi:CheY-like chemotaxis protein